MAQQRNSKKREVIIREASRLFLTKGYAAVLVDEVATNANVSKKTLYNHFENKKALLETCVEKFIRDYEQGAEELLGQFYDTVLDKLDAYLRFIGKSFSGAYLLLWSELKHEVPEIWSEMVHQRQKVLIDHLSTLTRQAIATGQIKDDGLAEMAIVMYISSMEQMNDSDYMSRFPDHVQAALPANIADRAAKALTLLFNGLLNRQEEYAEV